MTIKHCILLQSPAYAKALCPLYKQIPAYGLIMIDGEEAGLVQVMEARILNKVFHAMIIDGGPLWFSGYGSEDHFAAFMRAFNTEFPARWGRKRRFIPAMPPSPKIDAIMQNCGFKKTATPPYQTYWLDLTPPEEPLRAGLRKTWRQSLIKAEKSPLQIEWDETGRLLPWLLKTYDTDRRQKAYRGAEVATLRALGAVMAQENNLLIGVGTLDNRPVAAILMFCHGRSATYQVGWSSDDGKRVCAHHRLLWEAMLRLKARDINNCDLGGVHDDSDSLKTFKAGLGGELNLLAGLYV